MANLQDYYAQHFQGTSFNRGEGLGPYGQINAPGTVTKPNPQGFYPGPLGADVRGSEIPDMPLASEQCWRRGQTRNGQGM